MLTNILEKEEGIWLFYMDMDIGYILEKEKSIGGQNVVLSNNNIALQRIIENI